MTGHIVSILLTVVSGVLLFVIKGLLTQIKTLKTDQKKRETEWQDAISAGVVSLLRIQLIEYHDKYMTGDHIPTYVYENFDDMYKSYRALGGNGMITHMKEEIDSLRMKNK